MSDCRVPMPVYDRDEQIELKRASELFADCECAIETLCVGCPDECGWSFATDKKLTGTPCKYMVEDVSREDGKPIVMTWQGEPFCYMRYLRFVKSDYEKYQKRMRGDWS